MTAQSIERAWRSLGTAAGLLLALTLVLPHPPDWDLGSTTAAWFAGVLKTGLSHRIWWIRIDHVCRTVSIYSDYAIALLTALALFPRRTSPRSERTWFGLLLGARIVDSASFAVFWLANMLWFEKNLVIVLGLLGSALVLVWIALAACRRGDGLLHVMFVSTIVLCFWFVLDWLSYRREFDPSDHLAGVSSVLLLVSVIALARLRTQHSWAHALRDLTLLRVGRRRRGYCPKCGYNLTGLPEMRCPECGRQFTSEEAGS